MLQRRAGARVVAAFLTSSVSPLPLSAADAPRPGVDWPQFRGIRAGGVADGFATPLRWDVPNKQGVLWKTPMPGLGHSSPAVWGDLVCLTTAETPGREASLKPGLYGDIEPVENEPAQTWKVYCLDKKTGALRWQQTARTGKARVKRHTKSTHANSTVALDAGRVVALFGSEGLYAYDRSGRLLWSKDLGHLDSGFFMVPAAQWGYGSSPVIENGRVIVQADVQKDSFLAAFDAGSGRELWRTPRSDVPTWSTPTVYEAEGRLRIAVNGWKHLGGYDFASGKEVWRMSGQGDIPVPTPFLALDLIFFTQAHGPGSPIYAVRAAASGDASLAEGSSANAQVVWSHPRDGAYMPTPVVYRDQLYVCRNNGVLSAYEAKTGRRLYQERLGDGRSGITASLVAGDGKLYVTSEDGDVFVIKAGPAFELLARNPIGEVCLATPALSEGTLIFRTRDHVLAIAPDAAPDAPREAPDAPRDGPRKKSGAPGMR